MLVASIHRDHRNISRLLKLLGNKLTALQDEKAVNYNLIRDTVAYLQEHAEKYHHPKEDLIYHYYLERYPDADSVARLDQEHHDLAELTAEFANTVDMILMDAVVPQDLFAEKLNRFISSQKSHLELEERSVLPVLEHTLTTEDWAYLQSQWESEESDPLFGEQVADRFKELAAAL
ncbi:hemerythrin domain-containing protein [Enterovibrio paralichthyis]|uniref:hemerythrin domain-containing protein n=1 Tax=Enterovibrio paralichthyis TaxID=2853805 RepID=UPI0006D267CD|nr:hemerythrin domain-containing protein [Enterovibrio paralichthyis]MBV7299979.1 hemerythrin domain-containing protein [Enterovibrio paralichthyis]